MKIALIKHDSPVSWALHKMVPMFVGGHETVRYDVIQLSLMRSPYMPLLSNCCFGTHCSLCGYCEKLLTLSHFYML